MGRYGSHKADDSMLFLVCGFWFFVGWILELDKQLNMRFQSRNIKFNNSPNKVGFYVDYNLIIEVANRKF